MGVYCLVIKREICIITQYLYEDTMILEKNSKQRDVKM